MLLDIRCANGSRTQIQIPPKTVICAFVPVCEQLKATTPSHPHRNNPVHINLTGNMKQAIRLTWNKIKDGEHAAAAEVFWCELEGRSPSTFFWPRRPHPEPCSWAELPSEGANNNNNTAEQDNVDRKPATGPQTISSHGDPDPAAQSRFSIGPRGCVCWGVWGCVGTHASETHSRENVHVKSINWTTIWYYQYLYYMLHADAHKQVQPPGGAIVAALDDRSFFFPWNVYEGMHRKSHELWKQLEQIMISKRFFKKKILSRHYLLQSVNKGHHNSRKKLYPGLFLFQWCSELKRKG